MSLLPVARAGQFQFYPAELPSLRLVNDGYTLVAVRNLSGADRKLRLRTYVHCQPGGSPHVDELTAAAGTSLHLWGAFERAYNGDGGILEGIWLDDTGAALADSNGLSVAALTLRSGPTPEAYQTLVGLTQTIGGTPLEIPVATLGQEPLKHYVPSRNGNRYRCEGGECLLVRNDRGSTIYARLLAQRPCEQGGLHHLEAAVATGGWTLLAPVDSGFYRAADGYCSFMLTGTNGGLLSNNDGMGVAAFRVRRNLA